MRYRIKNGLSNLDLSGDGEEMHMHISGNEWQIGHFSTQGFIMWTGEPYEKILQEIKIKSLGYI